MESFRHQQFPLFLGVRTALRCATVWKDALSAIIQYESTPVRRVTVVEPCRRRQLTRGHEYTTYGDQARARTTRNNLVSRSYPIFGKPSYRHRQTLGIRCWSPQILFLGYIRRRVIRDGTSPPSQQARHSGGIISERAVNQQYFPRNCRRQLYLKWRSVVGNRAQICANRLLRRSPQP